MNISRSVCIAALLLGALRSANAEPSRRLGGCTKSNFVCWGPAASLSLAQINLSSRVFTAAIAPGLGYGVTFWADKPYSVGVSFHFTLSQSEGMLPGVFTPVGMISFAEYFRIGFGARVTDNTQGAGNEEALMLIGFGLDFGSTPQSKKEEDVGISSKPSVPGPNTETNP